MKIEKETLKEKWLIFLVLGVMLLAYAYKGGYLGTTFGQFISVPARDVTSFCSEEKVEYIADFKLFSHISDLYNAEPNRFGFSFLCGGISGIQCDRFCRTDFVNLVNNYKYSYIVELKDDYGHKIDVTDRATIGAKKGIYGMSDSLLVYLKGPREIYYKLMDLGWDEDSHLFVHFKITFTKVIDSDKDGIPDDEDLCPNEPGIPQLNGCPPECMMDEDCPDIPIKNGMKIGSCVNYECEYTIVCDEGYELKDGECVKISPFTGLITFLKTNPIIIGLIALVIIGIIFYKFRGV